MNILERLINWNRATKNDGDLFFAEFDRLYSNCQTLKTGVETETADRQQADGNLQTAIDGKRSILDSYSKTETDTALLGKRDVSDSYSQTEIDNALLGKISSTEKGVPNGVANLNSNGLIPASLIPDKSKIKVINNIAERDSQYTPPMDNEGNVVDGYLVLVMDASADPTVGSGWASYCWNASGSAWFKTNEGESIEGVIDWVNVQNKPTEFTPSAHSHAIADVSNLQTALDGKRDVSDSYSKTETDTLISKFKFYRYSEFDFSGINRGIQFANACESIVVTTDYIFISYYNSVNNAISVINKNTMLFNTQIILENGYDVQIKSIDANSICIIWRNSGDTKTYLKQIYHDASQITPYTTVELRNYPIYWVEFFLYDPNTIFLFGQAQGVSKVIIVSITKTTNQYTFSVINDQPLSSVPDNHHKACKLYDNHIVLNFFQQSNTTVYSKIYSYSGGALSLASTTAIDDNGSTTDARYSESYLHIIGYSQTYPYNYYYSKYDVSNIVSPVLIKKRIVGTVFNGSVRGTLNRNSLLAGEHAIAINFPDSWSSEINTMLLYKNFENSTVIEEIAKTKSSNIASCIDENNAYLFVSDANFPYSATIITMDLN
jgi:hypothetical protein